MNSNTIVMRLLEKEVARSRGLFQYDYGQRLVFTGVELPDAYEVHFSNNKVGVSKTVIGDATGVDIPDEFLLKGDPVYVWVFLHTGDADGETEYHGVIDVIKRAKPVHDKPTPAQQDEITQAIAVLNAAVTTTGQDVVDATEAKDAAEAAQAAAEEAQGIAEDARDEAVQAKNAAVSAAEAAEAAKDAAVEAKETSEEIAEALPGTIEAALQEAKDSGEFDGATFVPSIDDGVISWTNDRQLPNPEPVDIAKELELDTYAKKDEIPTKVSELTNDSGYLTTETDPTVSAWAKQPNKPSYTAQEVGAIDVAQKGTANGVAELDADGKVKSGQLPSYVDDVAEYDSMSQFPATGESGKIYIAKDTNITYRWGGSSYVPIGSDLALGETASTAYRGDRGKIAYDHASAKGNAYANGLYKIATNAEGHVTGATPVVKSDITGLGIPGSVPTKTSELQNDSGFITTETDPTVASWAKEPTKPTYTASEVGLGNVANERQYSANNPPPADTTKQDKINVNGILKGTGNGGVTAAVEGTDYINGDLIAVQDETPTDPNTQIWLPETQPESVQVASYAELTNVLNALNLATDFAETTADSPSSDWEQGIFQVSNGTKSSSTTRLRTATAEGVNGDVISASCKTNYQALMFCWAGSTYLGIFQNNSFVKVDANWETSFDLSKARSLGATIIKFQFRKTDNSTLTATDGENLVYTTVSLGIKNRVEKLESDILQSASASPTADWEQGALQVSNGTTISNNARIRTVSNGIGNSVVMASCNDGYQGFLCCYANGSYIGIYEDGIFKKENVSWASSWNLEDARSAGADVFRLVVKRTDGADLLPSEGANILYTSAKDMLLSLYKDHRYLSGCYKGKRISILGDSISTYGGSVSDPTNERYSQEGNPYTYVGNRCRYPQKSLGVTDPNQTYWMRLINTLGLQLGINDSWASTRVSWDGTTESTDIGANKYIASQTRIGHLGENGTPDYILVNAGTNDIINNVTIGSIDDTDPSLIDDFSSLPVSTFADAYRTLLARLMHTYSSARIVVLLPNFATGYGSKKQDNYCEVIKELCDMYGVPYLDMRVNGVTPFNKSTYLGDGVHYNAQGMSLVANELIRQFITLI